MEIHTSLILHDSISCSSFPTNPLADGIRYLRRAQPQEPPARSKLNSFSSFSRHGPSSLQMDSSCKHQFSIFSATAVGSNTNVDTEDMFDDLFKKYGKVVFRRNDQKPAPSEIDDDAESLSCDVVVHIFLPQLRAFYNLEEFYGNATPIELPFENQQQFHN